MLGTTLGSYTLERELGRGGMGAVYTAVHTLLGRRAAVKVLLPELSRNQDIVQRFFNEAKAATAIKHPSIVEIYDFGWAPDGSAYIVMEMMEGESLGTRLQRLGRLAPAAAATITRQVANALAAAHRAGIVHRDLKPDNVFLVHDVEVAGGERVKLLDFGIAKLAVDGAGSRTSTGVIMGTPIYMSPEQCEGARLVDARSDLYSLGCMLFEMLAGRPPFQNEGVGGLIGMHLYVAPPTLRSVVPDAPEALDAIVARLLAKPPGERFQTADELAGALGRISGVASSVPPHAMRTMTPPTGAPSWPPGPGPASGPSWPPGPAPGSPTTLSSAAGMAPTGPPAAPSRRGLWLALGGLVAVAGVAVAVVAGSGGAGSDASGAVGAVTTDGGAAAALATIDAAAEPVTAGDAAVAPDPLLAAARQALGDRRWASARSQADDVLRTDPTNADAAAIRAQAQRGVDAETNLDDMEKALKTKNWRVLRDELDAVYDATVDGDPARAEADALIAEARPRVFAEARDSIQRSLKKRDCVAAKKKATDTVARWGDEAKPLEELATRCKGPPDGGTVEVPPPPPPPPPQGDSAAELSIQAQTAAKSSQWARALRLAENGLAAGPDSSTRLLLTMTAALSACNLKNRDKAQQHFEGLPTSRKALIRSRCKAHGVLLSGPPEEPAEPPPPAPYSGAGY